MLSAQDHEPMRHIAQRVADCISKSGYAFIEDDKLEALAAALTFFLVEADIPPAQVAECCGSPRRQLPVVGDRRVDLLSSESSNSQSEP